MSISQRLIALRRERDLTQQEMADRVGLHVNQIRRYEAEQAQPSLEALKKIAIGLSISIDTLVFENGERGPDDDLLLQFEAVSRMPPEEKKIIKALLDGMIVKYQTKQLAGGLSSETKRFQYDHFSHSTRQDQ
jgi:transcriptional regulator with XRE-family HTH domain